MRRFKLPVFFVVILVSILLAQGCVKRLMDHVTFQVSPSRVLPTAVGVGYRESFLVHGQRKVRSWYVTPSNGKPAIATLILFNGIGGNLSGWRYFQKYFSENGIGTVCFEYGPLRDTLRNKGSSRLSDVTADVVELINELKQEQGGSLHLFLLAHSVGNAVLLEMYPQLDSSALKGIIICNAFSSMKQWGIDHGKIPKMFSFVFPNYYDNLRNVKVVHRPVLVVHSKADSINYYHGAAALYQEANFPKEFIRFDHFSHNDIFKESNLTYWQPILAFIVSQSSK